MKELDGVSCKETETHIENYLASHPGFFQDRQTLLDSLLLTRDDGNTISLIARQTENLRKQNESLRDRLKDLINIAETNNKTFDKCKSVIIKLISSNGREQFFSAIEESFKNEFKSTAYSLMLFGNSERRINHFTSIVSEQHASENIGLILESNKPKLGILKPIEKKFLFGPSCSKVKSSAILLIRNKTKLIGVLSIGSNDESYFEPDQETNFIGLLGEVLGLVIPRILEA